MARFKAQMFVGTISAALALVAPAPIIGFDASAAEPVLAFRLESTVMLDDGSDTCATDIHVFHDAGDSLLFCYTLTNTGTEGLTLHDVSESHSGQIAGPGDPTVVAPGESMSVTTTFVMLVTGFHKVSWSATGVDSGIEVTQYDTVYHTIQGTEVQLDMTVMVDDGNDTCGTETSLAVPSGTQVRLCYTMTNTFDEPLDTHFLLDEHLGTLLGFVGPEIDSGESLVHTEVETMEAAGLWTSTWEAHGVDTDVVVGGVDSVMIELADPDVTVPCVTSTALEVPTTPPPTTSSTTTSTQPQTTTTSTTSTSTTTHDDADGHDDDESGAGLADDVHDVGRACWLCRCRSRRAAPGVDASGGGAVPGDAAWGEQQPGGSLPATGTDLGMLVVLAALSVATGLVGLHTGRRRHR